MWCNKAVHWCTNLARRPTLLRPPAELTIPEELLQKFEREPTFQQAFRALTPGRQKGYIFQIAAAKRPSTRISRIEKYTAQILAGRGYNE